jgi:hypothetical protein
MGEARYLVFDDEFSFLDGRQSGWVRLKFSFFVPQLRLECFVLRLQKLNPLALTHIAYPSSVKIRTGKV